MARILIVEDELDAAEMLALNLRNAGYEVEVATDGGQGLQVARTVRPDLIVLDQMLPSMSGTEICMALRAAPDTADLPIIMLTARAAEVDRVRGLEVGADDYVTKPYSIKELILRIQALLRRRGVVQMQGDVLKIGLLEIHLSSQEVVIAGERQRLTSTELKFLSMLARAAGQSVSRQQLLKEVWNYAETTDSRTVDSHVRRLRAKLGDMAEALETVPGVGYRLKAL
jgi:two-component system, OmpR family, phosphate regulon response regulator PhoB